jgi:hypothetical protein
MSLDHDLQTYPCLSDEDREAIEINTASRRH